MSYQVLARKWRPQTFDATVGQQHVLQALKNALEQNRLHHAYLFTGTRGVGKTTIARILAKALNCEQGISATPCGQCDSCKEIEQGRFVDLIEVDAASRTKVEDTRELLDNVQYAPTRGRFKIYLIDEVHMLSGHSFNALLKTLEEPPPHVKFLLATTDPQKLPITVLSRCLQFHLKSLSIEQISNHLQTVLDSEGISYEQPALLQLAKAANGSIRDSLSILEQAIAYCQGELNSQGINEMLGTIEQDAITPILSALQQKDANQLLNQSHVLTEKALDFQQVLDELASMLHYITIAQVAPEAINQYQTNADMIKNFANQFSKEDVQLYYQIAITGKRDLSLAPDPRIGFEMTLLRMLAFTPVMIPTTTHTATSNTEKKTVKPAANTASQAVPVQPATTKVAKASSTSTSLELTQNNWPQIVAQLNVTGIAKLLASNCSFVNLDEQQLSLKIAAHHSSLVNDRTKQRLTEVLQNYLNKPLQLSIDVTEETVDSPFQRQTDEKQKKQQDTYQTLSEDPGIKELINTFDTKLTPDAVKPND